jgi:phage virion morphogenesis protein
MTGTMLVVEIDDRQFRHAMERLAARAKDMTTVLRGIGEYLVGTTQDRFKTQTAPDGTPWQPLQAWYQREKPQNADKILTLRGHLRNTLHWQVIPDELLVGSSLEYAAIHQFGGEIQAKKGRALSLRGRFVTSVTIPARPYLGISPADGQEVEGLVADYLAGAINGDKS